MALKMSLIKRIGYFMLAFAVKAQNLTPTYISIIMSLFLRVHFVHTIEGKQSDLMKNRV